MLRWACVNTSNWELSIPSHVLASFTSSGLQIQIQYCTLCQDSWSTEHCIAALPDTDRVHAKKVSSHGRRITDTTHTHGRLAFADSPAFWLDQVFTGQWLARTAHIQRWESTEVNPCPSLRYRPQIDLVWPPQYGPRGQLRPRPAQLLFRSTTH